MMIEWEELKRFRLYRAKSDGIALNCVAEGDTQEEVESKYERRSEWHYRMRVDGVFEKWPQKK